MRKFSCLTLLAIFVVFFSIAASAQTVSLGAFKSGLTRPVFMTNAKDGSHRIFIVEQAGVIKVVQPGTETMTDFLDIRSIVKSDTNEQGLLGLAFHPQYATNRRFFVYYISKPLGGKPEGAIQISEFQTSAGNANLANTTEKIIITIPHPTYTNHNGGTIAFGPDGYLYAGTGDGGSGNDPSNNAQNKNVLLGKFIRLNIDVPAGSNAPYTIPPDNPFVGNAGYAPEIYALGMRNPYRWSFDRYDGKLWVGDVGQDAIEEADIITKGANYGWRIYEGTRCTGIDPCNTTNLTPPVFQYSSANPDPRCSITGGYVYRGIGGGFPNGAYIYADYCTGEIFKWQNNTQTLLLDSTRAISSFGEDEDGELYVVGLGGTVDRLIATGTTAATVSVGGRVTTNSGRGIGSVIIRLTDASGNVRTATTSSFGYYRFAEVAVGETYIITAKGKRYTFSQPSQVVNLDDDTYDVNFIANP